MYQQLMTEILERFLYDLYELKRGNLICFAKGVITAVNSVIAQSNMVLSVYYETDCENSAIVFQGHTEIAL